MNQPRPWHSFWIAFLIAAVILVPYITWSVPNLLEASGRVLEGSDFQNVKVSYHGQEARISGQVDSRQLMEKAEELLNDNLRVGPAWWTGKLNPLRRIRNELTVKPGYFFLIRQGDRCLLAGQTATNEEQEHIISAAGSLIPPKADTLVLHTAAELLPCANLKVTTDSLAAIAGKWQPKQPILLAGNLGSALEEVDHSLDENSLNVLFEKKSWPKELGISLSAQLRQWIAQDTEAEKNLALPSPYLIILLAGEDVLLRGQVASAELKSLTVAAARRIYDPLSLTDEIVVSDQCRRVDELGKTLTTFPPAPDPDLPGRLGFVIPGFEWKSKDLEPSGFEPTGVGTWNWWTEKFNPDWAAGDLAILGERHTHHLQELQEQALSKDRQPSYLALCLAGNEVALSGEFSSETTRNTILQAAQEFYTSSKIKDQLRISDQRRPISKKELAALIKNFPVAPAPDSPGAMAFMIPGLEPTAAAVPPVELRPEEFQEFVAAKLLPESMLADSPKADFASFLSLIATHRRHLSGLKLIQFPPQPYLAMLAMGKRIVIRGDAGSLELKKSVIHAAKTFYRNRELIDEIRIDSKPPIVIKPGFTLRTFPPPPKLEGPGLLAFNMPGQPWLQVPLTWDMPTRESLKSAGLFSKNFDPAQAWPDYEAWLPELAARPKPILSEPVSAPNPSAEPPPKSAPLPAPKKQSPSKFKSTKKS